MLVSIHDSDKVKMPEPELQKSYRNFMTHKKYST